MFGNGDVMSFEDHNLAVAKSGVSGIMVARGALIKPWIFTEIKEQRHWDIQVLCDHSFPLMILFRQQRDWRL